MQNSIVRLILSALATVCIFSGCSEDNSSGPQNPPAPEVQTRVIQESHIDWVLKFVHARFIGSDTRQAPRPIKIALAGAFAQEALSRAEFTETDLLQPVNQVQLQRIFNTIQERHL